MNHLNDLQNERVEKPASIQRSPCPCDLPSLADDPTRTSRKSRYRQSISFSSVDQSDFNGSENSQILYMSESPKKSRELRDSLSSIGNQSTRIMDGTSDIKAEGEGVSPCEKLAWTIIDREIFEWQYVCRTGRPYWWSPESKYVRLKKLQARLSNAHPRPRTREMETCPSDVYNRKRRALSDSFLAGQDCLEDLAHLVAVQLLGSCFTLPPDPKAQNQREYSYDNFNTPLNSPDPQLISSLRMHTQFRCSPCFGHQARNTSPAQCWSGAYDGPFPSSSPPPIETGLNTPAIGTAGSLPSLHRAHRALRLNKGSASSSDDQGEEYPEAAGTHNLDPAASTTTSCGHHAIDDGSARVIHPSPRSARGQRPKPAHTDSDTYMPGRYRGVQVQSSSRPPTTNYRLQPMIRSEPHPVFVQPVKELVIKRWKTFRRRFGGSLHAYLPTGWEDELSEISSPGQSGPSSPAMSSDGRSRRRRAQERDQIHSSVDSIPHNNSPASGCDTPDGNILSTPFWVDSTNASPDFQLADPLATAAALALADTQARPVQSPNSSYPKPPILSDSLASPTRPEFPLNSSVDNQSTTEVRIAPKSTVDPAASSYTNRIRKRQHRKSMLSEMHMPEDFAENVASGGAFKEPVGRSLLSTEGGALHTPQEEAESNIGLVIHSRARESIGNLGRVGTLSVRRMTVSSDMQSRPRLSRTSTTATQVFTPSDEGVEIDGLPAGPSKDFWNSFSNRTGKRRERTYL